MLKCVYLMSDIFVCFPVYVAMYIHIFSFTSIYRDGVQLVLLIRSYGTPNDARKWLNRIMTITFAKATDYIATTSMAYYCSNCFNLTVL